MSAGSGTPRPPMGPLRRRRALLGVLCGAVAAGAVAGAVWLTNGSDSTMRGDDPARSAAILLGSMVGATGLGGSGAGGEGSFSEGVAACDPGVPGRDVTLLPVCAESGTLKATSTNAIGARASWDMAVGLVECASGVLEAYEGLDGISLEHDGYLDLFGRIWGCVVASDEGWAEVAVVEGEGDEDGWAEGDVGGGGRCTVTLVRVGREV